MKVETDKLEKIKVKEVMLRELTTVTPTTSLSKIIGKFKKQTYPCLPVIEEDRLVGIISEAEVLDLFRAPREEAVGGKAVQEQKKATASKAEDLMAPEPVFVESEQSLREALELMRAHKKAYLPVVERGEFKGLISLRHILGSL